MISGPVFHFIFRRVTALQSLPLSVLRTSSILINWLLHLHPFRSHLVSEGSGVFPKFLRLCRRNALDTLYDLLRQRDVILYYALAITILYTQRCQQVYDAHRCAVILVTTSTFCPINLSAANVGSPAYTKPDTAVLQNPSRTVQSSLKTNPQRYASEQAYLIGYPHPSTG